MPQVSGKEALLLWCKNVCGAYPGVEITNFTKSWQNGLGFCAILHAHRPELIGDFLQLKKENAMFNLEKAFRAAESIGIPALLDAEDIAVYPEQLSIITYLSQYYHAFRSQQTKSGAGVASIQANPASASESLRRKSILLSQEKIKENQRKMNEIRRNSQAPPSSNCSKCTKPITEGEIVCIESENLEYHKACFVMLHCTSCSQKVGKSPMFVNGKITCERCGKAALSQGKSSPITSRHSPSGSSNTASPAQGSSSVASASASGSSKCGNCSKPIVGKFCSSCGNKAAAVPQCPKCSKPVAGKFCSSCGTKMDAPSASQAPPLPSKSAGPALPPKNSPSSSNLQRERDEKEKKERMEKEKKEKERTEKEKKERMEKEKKEKERMEKEKKEKERDEKEKKERMEKEKKEKEEKEQRERERKEREVKEKMEQDQREKELKERRERRERERKEQEERERKEQEEREKRRQDREKREKERIEREKQERERLDKERQERERIRKERERLEQEKLENERKEKVRLENERKEREEKERKEKERQEEERKETERLLQEKLEIERELKLLEQDQKEKERLEQERKRKEKELLDKQEREKREEERKRVEKEREEKERLQREQNAHEQRQSILDERDRLSREDQEFEKREEEILLRLEKIRKERDEIQKEKDESFLIMKRPVQPQKGPSQSTLSQQTKQSPMPDSYSKPLPTPSKKEPSKGAAAKSDIPPEPKYAPPALPARGHSSSLIQEPEEVKIVRKSMRLSTKLPSSPTTNTNANTMNNNNNNNNSPIVRNALQPQSGGDDWRDSLRQTRIRTQQEAIRLEGWLLKKKDTAGLIEWWASRYFCVREDSLLYYRAQPKKGAKSVTPDGVISLRSVETVEPISGKRPFVFALKTKAGITYEFQAKTEWEELQWMAGLVQIITFLAVEEQEMEVLRQEAKEKNISTRDLLKEKSLEPEAVTSNPDVLAQEKSGNLLWKTKGSQFRPGYVLLRGGVLVIFHQKGEKPIKKMPLYQAKMEQYKPEKYQWAFEVTTEKDQVILSTKDDMFLFHEWLNAILVHRVAIEEMVKSITF